MKKKDSKILGLPLLLKIILLLYFISYTSQDCSKMSITNFASNQFIPGGSASAYDMSIATYEKEGSLWYGSRALRIYPKFELQTTVRIPDTGCDSYSWAMDGFTFIFTQTKPPYTNGMGGYIGYYNLYNALVIEVDLNYNSEFGDLSSNSLSLHRCYGKNCSPIENSDTIQRQLPINYDRCAVMRYTFNIQYNPGQLNIYWGNGVLLLSANEDLFEKFQGWAYFGYTGFFRGNRKRLYVENSYFCEDTLSNDIDFAFIGFTGREITVPAASTNTLLVSFKDHFGYTVPHFLNLDIIDWSITVDPECGNARFGSYYSAFHLAFDIFDCNKAGPYNIKIIYGSTNIEKAYLPKYTIVARAFEKNSLVLPNGFLIKSINGMNYLVQSNSDSFAMDLLTNGVISFNVTVTDTFDNPYSLPSTTYTNDLAFTCIKTDGSPAPTVIINKNKLTLFQIDLKIPSPGRYKVSANKFDPIWVQVNAGRPFAESSYCSITSGSTQILTGTEVQYTCYLNDKNKYPLTVDEAQNIYKTDFSCLISRSYLTNSTISEFLPVPNSTKTAYICKFTPTFEGTYSFLATFQTFGLDKVFIPSSSNSFTVYSPVNFNNMNYFDFTQLKWVGFSSSRTINIVFSPSGESLLKLDFLDSNNVSFGQNGIGFFPKFSIADFSGTISNPHDNTNIKTISLSFNKASNQVISVSIPNANIYFVRTSFPYILSINYQGKVYNFNFYTQLSNNGNRLVCSHDMFPANTLIESSGITNIPVNQETVLASISLRTTDNSLYNYLVDKNKAFSFTFSPKDNLANPNFDIVPSTIDGIYTLKVKSIRAGTFKLSIEVLNVNEKTTYPSKVFDYNVSVLPDPIVGLIDKVFLSQFKDPAGNILNDKTNDDDIRVDLIFKDIYENILNLAPNKSNNYLGLTVNLNINNKSYNVNWDNNTINIIYINNTYQLVDNYKLAGNYIITISTKLGSSFIIYYKKEPGKVSISTSTVTFSSNPDINVGEYSEISLNLLDNYGENLMNGNKDTRAMALSLISVAADSIIFPKPNEAGYIFVSKSDPISITGKFNIKVMFNGNKLLCTQNCVQTVSYPSIQFSQTVVNIIAGGVTSLSKTSAQKIVNKTNDLLLNFFFFNSSGKQLNIIDPNLVSQITCVIIGQNYNNKPTGNLINNAYIYFSFTPGSTEYNNYQAAVYGNYKLSCSYKKYVDAVAEVIEFPLNLVGDGEANDAGNGDIVLSNTVFSTNTLNNIAGIDGTLNLEFRTSENLRYNQFDPDYKTNFVFDLSIQDEDLKKFKIEMGIKKGTYIITMNSRIARYAPNPVIITIKYKGVNIPTKLNFFNTHNDLTYIKIKDISLMAPNSNQLKDGTTVSSYNLIVESYDKYNNFFLQIFDPKFWSLNRIQRLLNLKHSNSQAVISVSVVNNPTDMNIVYTIVCTVAGKIEIGSSFLTQIYNLNILPGPVSIKSYATILTSTIISGGQAQIKVFPLDNYSNVIPLSRITPDEKSRFKITVNQPILGPLDATYLSQNDSENSFTYNIILKKTGINLFSPTFSQTDIPCNNCQVNVNIGPIVFANSQLYLQSSGIFVLQSIKDPVNVPEKTYPSLNFYLHDQYMNRYPSIPDNLSFEIRWTNSAKNYLLTTTNINDALVINIGKEIRYDFQFLLVGTYKLSITKTLIDDKTTEKLDYTINLIGDPPDPNASNDEMDPSQTFVSKSKVLTTAGQVDIIFLEIRTKEGKRRNYHYEDPEKSIILNFSKDNGNKDIYSLSIIPAEKFGQYYIQVSSKKSYTPLDNNNINISIEGKICDKILISYVITPSFPQKGFILNQNGNRLTNSTKLPDGNSDNVYSFNMVLVDSYNNICNLTPGDLNYKIDIPEGKTCNGCVSSVIVNSDSTFTVSITPKSSGTYKITSSFMKDQTYTFYSAPGKPSATNSRAEVPKSSVAGDAVNLIVLPFDKNNNLIDATTLPINSTYNAYVKWSEYGIFSNYVQIPGPVISDITYQNSTIKAIKYTYIVTKRDKNFFRVTLGTTTEISCDNCITSVTPSDPDFKNYLLQRFDSDQGVYVTLNGDFSEQNEKSNPFYSLFPRDRFGNIIDKVDDLSLYSATLTSDKITIKFVLGNLSGELDQIKFRNDEDNILLNPTLYKNLVSGFYTLKFFKKNVTDPLTFKVRLIGSGDNSDASNDDFEIKNVAIKEQSLSFVAGSSGYFIIEMRTTINTRRNEWGYTITPVPTLESNTFSYKVNQAGKKGQYYVAVFTKKANNYPQLTAYKLDIYITSPGKTEKVKSPLSLDLVIDPDVLTKAEITQEYLKPSTINILDGNADNNLLFNVKGYDAFGNQASPNESLIKLTVVDQSLSQVLYKSGKDVLKGIITFNVSTKITGTYTLTSPVFYDSSNNKIIYKYQNLPGELYVPNSIIIDISSEVVAGEKAKLRIIPRDKNKNYINDDNSIKLYSTSLLTSSLKSVDMTSSLSTIENTQGLKSILFTVTLTEKGKNTWSLYYNNLAFDCPNCQTNVKPADAVLENSIISITNNSGQYIVTNNGGSSSNNNAIPFTIQVKLRDKYLNYLDSVDSLIIEQSSCILSGNYMTPITFLKTKDADRLIFRIDSNDVLVYNRLVSGNNYDITIILNTKTNSYTHKIIEQITSNRKDDDYGNGDYVVSKTILSLTKVDLNANGVKTIKMTLYTAQGKIYNNDIDLTYNKKDYEYVVTPTPYPGSFYFYIYKASTAPGIYNIDIKITKITSIDAINNLKIMLRPVKNDQANKQYISDITFTIKPEVPPDPTKTEINTLPEKINVGDRVSIQFVLYDQFGNKYIKNSGLLFNLNLLNYDQPITTVNKQLLNDYQYDFSFIPVYPPRQLSLQIMYTDNTGKNLMIHLKPLTTYIISQPTWKETIVSGSNMQRMKAGEKLDLNIYLIDINRKCVDTDDKILMSTYVVGPLENSDDKKVYLTYDFTLKKKDVTSKADCNNYYAINIPDNNNYYTVGKYRITVSITNQNIPIKEFNQYVSPQEIDISKFISTWTNKGDFNPGRVIAGTALTFEIQAYDKYMNKVNDPIPKSLNCTIVPAPGSDLTITDRDYTINVAQNENGKISGSVKIFKTGNFIFKYTYDGVILSIINNIQGPNQIAIYPTTCSEKYPKLEKTQLDKVIPGENTSFLIYCFDQFNNKIFSGGEFFDININVVVTPSLVSTSINSVVTDRGDGSYRVDFIPVYPGTYSVGIVLKSKGNLYGNMVSFEIKSSVCPSDSPIRCPNNPSKCVKNNIECIDKNPCANTPATPISCLVNKVLSCVASQVICDCPDKFIKCEYMNVCIPETQEYLCSFNLELNCAKQFPTKPYFCPDGICRASINDCPAQRVCPLGYNLCPDLSCQKDRSNCSPYEDCIGNQIKCPDQTCVTNQKDCPSTITCSKPGQFVCPDGKCVSTDLECNPVPICNAPNNILCPSNTCTNSITNCPKSVACGHGKSLCSDIQCKESC